MKSLEDIVSMFRLFHPRGQSREHRFIAPAMSHAQLCRNVGLKFMQVPAVVRPQHAMSASGCHQQREAEVGVDAFVVRHPPFRRDRHGRPGAAFRASHVFR
jgi:hypothetical protein